ncbi:DUF1796 family putative cysteine peptidase [Lichenicola sp.]|uniref:DUF1796 family putative cysteine peptidase n=1 Tax=Lichenicola sp. TaxID=2804529 RepID=UPI003AFFDCDB
MFQFVSLGGDCQPAAQIRKRRPSSVAHFFDWIGIPIRQTIELIRNDFEGFFDRENLHPHYAGDGFYGIVEMRYRADVQHGVPSFDIATTEAIRELFVMRARWLREMLEEDNDPVYFIRSWTVRDGPENEADAIELFELLRSKRRDIRLLYLHNDPGREDRISGGYRSAYLRQASSPYVWSGDDRAWLSLLEDFAVRPGGDDKGASPLPAPRRPRFMSA